MIKVINQNAEVWRQNGYDLQSIYDHVARCARVCYTPDIEVLTDSGWKRFDNLKNKDNVLSYNPETNSLLYDKANFIINDYDDDLVCINNQYIQLSVTKEHRMYLDDTYNKYNYKFIKAIDMFNKAQSDEYKEFRLPKKFKDVAVERIIEIPKLEHTKVINGGYHKDTTKTIKFDYNKSFIDLLGVFITEGHTYHGENYGTGSYCQITQSENKELYNIVINALNNLGLKYRIYNDPRKKQIKWIRFGDSVLVDYFDKLVGKGSHNIHLPKWFRNIPDDDLKRLIYILYLGDGSHNTTRREHYCSVSKRLLDEIQELFILLGSAATVSYSNDARYCYTNELVNNNSVCRKKDMYLKHYKGKVYCTSTKSGIICVRKNGIMCWCGNCYQSAPKNKDESSYDFLKRTILRGKDIDVLDIEDLPKLHLSVFEHGTLHLRIPKHIGINNFFIRKEVIGNNLNKTNVVAEKNNNLYYYVTTNMRVAIEYGYDNYSEYIDDDNSHADMYPKRITLNLTTDIGCSRELNRHRCHSISEESTRYCRYSADKFGGNITIAKLPWIDYKNDETEETNYENGFYADNELYDDINNKLYGHTTDGWSAIDWFLYGVQISNLVYNKCVQLGWTAQQAREILPLNTKTQLVHTAFIEDWNKFINLRCNEVSGKVHPMMKELALKIKNVIDNEYK